MSVTTACPQCGNTFDATTGNINRARKVGAPLYCGRKCAGLARRLKNPPTEAERKEAKRRYDAQRRIERADEIKAQKREYFRRTYDPVKAAIKRKTRMPLHVEYCRQPRYKAWKREYDKKYRAQEYGPFADAYMLAIDLNREIKSRSSNHEIRLQNQTHNKRQARTRSAQTPERSRNSRAQG